MSGVMTRTFAVWALAVTAGLGPAGTAAAQQDRFPYLAVVDADDVFVRSGADLGYYPFGRLSKGSVVKVIGEKSLWARVVTLGPAFRTFFGYIKFPRTEAGRVRVSADGKTGVTLASTDLFAPNLDARYDPNSSWKPLMKLRRDSTVTILETVESQGDVIHKVAIPGDAQGWISLTALRPPTPAEETAWEAAVGKPSAASGPDVPKPAVTPTPVVPATPPAQTPLARPALEIGDEAAATSRPAPRVTRRPARIVDPQAVRQRQAMVNLDALEAAYRRLLDEPLETAEVAPLRQLYLDLAKTYRDAEPVADYAQTRARQLSLWADVQQQKIELAQIVARARRTARDAKSARETIQRSGGYIAVGRLDASVIYDGRRLPKLLRVRDTETGRTLGYLKPDEKLDLAGKLGRLVGVVGEKAYDGELRVHVIQPRRIDVLKEPSKPPTPPPPAKTVEPQATDEQPVEAEPT